MSSYPSWLGRRPGDVAPSSCLSRQVSHLNGMVAKLGHLVIRPMVFISENDVCCHNEVEEALSKRVAVTKERIQV
jgi:hypothetical protein